MNAQRQIHIPTLVRIKPGALDRMGIYARRHELGRVVVLLSEALPEHLVDRLDRALADSGIEVLLRQPVREASLEQAQTLFAALPSRAQAVIGLGGGKALDTAKYVAFLARLPCLSVPTSLSNDGFCSPQSSLTVAGRRRSLPSRMPFGVVIDTAVTREAPVALWWSGVGDLVSKVTAVRDWKLAFHARGTFVDDFAALLSDATVSQFMARPARDPEGERLLGTALMLNGVAMEVSGSSRPASGSEHLISHALDGLSRAPRLHGLQVGVATYLVSHLQRHGTDEIVRLFEKTRFWDAFSKTPLSRREWLDAVRVGPSLKDDYYTVLSERDCGPEVEELLSNDPLLEPIFEP
jgi:glycerol-1-phosphate dehydrogenase [NAD(P)+]